MKNSSIGILIIAIFALVAPSQAEILPHYPSTYIVEWGYSFSKETSSATAVEHLDTKDSFGLKTRLQIFPLPTRFHLELNFRSERSFYLDTGYAWKDILLSRFVSVRGIHNIAHLPLGNDPDSTHAYKELNPNGYYSLKHTLYDLRLRLKAPGYPFHIFGRYFGYHQDGTFQQRYLIGDFTTSTMTIYSIKRKINKKTDTFTVGTNAHLGPLEVEYAFRYKEFHPSAQTTISDSSGIHNVLPKLRTTAHSIRFHTSYTGRVVASFTLQTSEEENLFSNISRDLIFMAANVRYLPKPWLTIAVRTSYGKKTQDSPETINTRLGTVMVRHTPESEIATIETYMRIRPLKKTNLLFGYSYRNKHLEKISDWPLLADSGRYQQYRVKLYTPLTHRIHFRAEYRYEDNSPIYNSEPDRADNFSLTAEGALSNKIIPSIFYRFRHTTSKKLLYLTPVTQKIVELSQRRKGLFHQLGILTGINISEDLSITPSVSYTYSHLTGPVVIFDYLSRAAIIYESQKYKEESFVYGLLCLLKLNDIVQASVSVSHTTSHGKASLARALGGIEQFFKHNYNLTAAELHLNIRLKKHLFFKPSILYSHYQDKTELTQSGDSYQAMIFLSRKI